MSSDIAIKVSGISKSYRLGETLRRPRRNLREVIMATPRVLLRKAKLMQPVADDPSTEGSDVSNNGLFWALKDISFELPKGEVLGIIGSNGAGKSTLLKVLSKITRPTKGRAEIHGRVGSLLEVGTGFNPELTGRENVYLNGAILGMRKVEIDARYDEIIAFSGVEKFIDTPVKRYSSGMRVRLAFAVAAHLEPEILIIDEVLTVGDQEFQQRCLGKMDDVAAGGRSILLVSHKISIVQQLCTRALWLKDGRLVEDGDVKDVVAAYLATVNMSHDESATPLYDMLRPRNFGKFIRLSRCRIINSTGEDTQQISFAEPFSIELECIALTDVDNISFFVAIDSRVLGANITTSNSRQGAITTSVKKGDTVTARLAIDDLVLNPGEYILSLALHGAKRPLDKLTKAKFFTVTSLLHDTKIVPSGFRDLVYLPPKWAIT